MIYTGYAIVPTDRSVDARAAADACNKALMDQGDTHSREAAEAQIASCAESLRGSLEILDEDFEMWEAWEDGKRDEAEWFMVPVGGTADVAKLGASALGVDVSESLNVKRI